VEALQGKIWWAVLQPPRYDLSYKSQSEPFYEWAIERAKPICKRVAIPCEMHWRMMVTLVNGMIMPGPVEGPNHSSLWDF
jgi:hypothetical protein